MPIIFPPFTEVTERHPDGSPKTITTTQETLIPPDKVVKKTTITTYGLPDPGTAPNPDPDVPVVPPVTFKESNYVFKDPGGTVLHGTQTTKQYNADGNPEVEAITDFQENGVPSQKAEIKYAGKSDKRYVRYRRYYKFNREKERWEFSSGIEQDQNGKIVRRLTS